MPQLLAVLVMRLSTHLQPHASTHVAEPGGGVDEFVQGPVRGMSPTTPVLGILQIGIEPRVDVHSSSLLKFHRGCAANKDSSPRRSESVTVMPATMI